MASKTAQTEYRRKLRRKNAGAAARRARENKGTTPVFPIHPPAEAKTESEGSKR